MSSDSHTLSFIPDIHIIGPQHFIYRHTLSPVNNLKAVFRDIRDYFAGNVTGITRDEVIAQTILRILLCKIHDEMTAKDGQLMQLARRPNEEPKALMERVDIVFEEVKATFPGLFKSVEAIGLSPDDIGWVISKVEDLSLLSSDRDVIADAFEELIGRSFRGGEGQFFTPRNVVQMMIDVLSPDSNERIIDPACGSGGFLAYILRHFVTNTKNEYHLAGIDKDDFLANLAKSYLTILGSTNHVVFCENSLECPDRWTTEARSTVMLGTYDVVLTNPPFGAKIPVIGNDLLRQYELGHAWINEKGGWNRTQALLPKQPPQILFIERCLQLLRQGGRMGIVLPEGIFGNSSDRYVWEYIQSVSSVMGVVSLSQETFQPSTHTKTSVLFLEKKSPNSQKIFMAIAKAIGHDKNGKELYKMQSNGKYEYTRNGNKVLNDDLPTITDRFNQHRDGFLENVGHLGFSIAGDSIRDSIYIPEYYDPEIPLYLKDLEQSGEYTLCTFGEFTKSGYIEVRRGNEIGSIYYGTGKIPFVRTTDIVNWEIKIDPVKAVSEDVYKMYARTQDIAENDILFVNDGTFLIGRSAIVTRLDVKIIIQSHLKRIRVRPNNEIDSYYLFYLLNTNIVKRQIEAKTFVQATISTLASRLDEVILPVYTDVVKRKAISDEMKEILTAKASLRERSMQIASSSP